MLLLSLNEKLIIEIRKHIFYFYVSITGILIVAVIPLVIHRIMIEFIIFTNPLIINLFFILVYAIFLIFVATVIFIQWTDYYIDVWLITDQRVVDFELKGLFHRDIVSVTLDKVVDVKVIINGVIENMLKIGDIHIQTAGTDKEFIIKGARNPEAMRDTILNAMHAYVSPQK